MTKKRATLTLGTVLAVCVPALVVAQQFVASRTPFGTNDPVTAAGLNLATVNACKIVVQTGASAVCPQNFVVLGGGCRTGAAGQNLRGFGPSFGAPGAFPDPDSFEADLFANGAVDNRGDSNPTGNNPQWDRFNCEPQTGATIQTTYATCCPLVPAQ